VRVVDVPTHLTEPFFPIAAALSGYPLPTDRPKVVVADPSFFDREREDGYVIYGLYDIDPNVPDVIFINPDTPTDMVTTVLVHEIVHWLQEKAGKPADTCKEIAAVEREAYLVDYMFAQLYAPGVAVLDMPRFKC
jgi:hypothetical protein